MHRRAHNGIEWLEFELLSRYPEVRHAVFLKAGGVSEPPYATLNAGRFVGDRSERVEENLRRLENIMGGERLISGKGIHGSAIASVNASSPSIIEGVDGLLTADKNLTLMMTHADCQIALFYDPEKGVIANVHAGWRGNIANIYARAIERMRDLFGCDPANLIACVSPSLSPDHAEFVHYEQEWPSRFWAYRKGVHFDLWAIAEAQLLDAGLLPEHIEIARLCTYKGQDDFFSYRRDGGITGRNAACIGLK